MNSFVVRVSCILLNLGLVAQAAVPAQAASITAGERSRIDAVFKQYDAPNVPGCALGIFRDGKIAYARGYGMADLERNIRISPESVFEVGSTSKQFAAAAIALLANAGKLSFNDDVHKYIPELPDYGAPLTLNELMWHTSGLRDYTDLLELAGYGLQDVTTDAEALSIIARQRALDFPSGSQFEYSNTNYFLLSVIVKRVTGMTLSEFVRQRIFKPLGMTHTLYRTEFAMLIPNRAMGYAPAGNGHFANSMSNWEQTGDGGVQISVEDAAKWDENFYNPVVGGPKLIGELQTPGHLANGQRLDYARGLFVETYRGLRLIQHGGAWIGYRAAFDRYPSAHTSIVTFCNSDAASPETLARNVADIVLNRYLAHTQAANAATAAKNSIPTSYLIGKYFDDETSEVLEIVAHRGGIALDLGGSPLPLQFAGGSSFKLGSTTVRFIMPGGAAATGLRLSGGGVASEYARRFTQVVPTPAQLQGSAGAYYSPELDVTWRMRIDGHTVALEPTRNLPDGAAGKLQPEFADTFSSDGGGFIVRFTRDSTGTITGFKLGAGRGLRALAFTRQSR